MRHVTPTSGATAYNFGRSPLVIDDGISLTDADGSNYNGGSLVVEFAAGAAGNDRLDIAHQGTGAGQIGVAGTVVSYGGVAIGTFSGGTGTSPLQANLNGNASPAAVQALMRRITYANDQVTPESAALGPFYAQRRVGPNQQSAGQAPRSHAQSRPGPGGRGDA